MIVCLCGFVSDKTILAARAAGARTIEAVAAATGAGTGCGCCHATITRLLAEPCKPEPCPGCPSRNAAESVPARIAASELKTP